MSSLGSVLLSPETLLLPVLPYLPLIFPFLFFIFPSSSSISFTKPQAQKNHTQYSTNPSLANTSLEVLPLFPSPSSLTHPLSHLFRQEPSLGLRLRLCVQNRAGQAPGSFPPAHSSPQGAYQWDLVLTYLISSCRVQNSAFSITGNRSVTSVRMQLQVCPPLLWREGSLSVRHTRSPERAFSDAAIFGRWSKENLAALWSDS